MTTYTNNTSGRMKIFDDVLKKVIILERDETYTVGKSKPKKEQIVVKTKPQTNSDFKKELESIKGIGKETVKDILNIYPTKAHLISAILKEEELPFRNDCSKKLKAKYQEEKS